MVGQSAIEVLDRGPMLPSVAKKPEPSSWWVGTVAMNTSNIVLDTQSEDSNVLFKKLELKCVNMLL